MLFGNIAPSPYDLQFSLLGVPIRVHPSFWVITLLMGVMGSSSAPADAVMWVVAVFVSIVVHEMGHAIVQRRFGGKPHVVLYSFGGLAFGNGADEAPSKQILISLAGPAAGFLLAMLTVAAIAATGRAIVPHADQTQFNAIVQQYRGAQGFTLPWGTYWFGAFSSPQLSRLVHDLLYVNIWWGILNLMPVYPLDGGQIARQLLLYARSPSWGVQASLKLSIGVAAALALWFFMSGAQFAAVLFGMLGYSNYQTLGAYRNSRGGG
ncbi:Peptidase family M50 [Pseudobythopirellula maris]|uniref:Peptidase family M50 n=1 Tax=Pseudobythopirellula maris TaxID=2527991 RepID=A0A5C5ZI04_9BACT|nr:site-2 protease family protein [Pseudobythopirellula maris]TWT86866.1 Peptidase family M50 [Pseudobythopirellula maris]